MGIFKNFLKNNISILFFLFFFLTIFPVLQVSYSATQGTIGSISSGTLNIQMTLSQIVKISELDDINFPAWRVGDGNVTAFDDLCIYSNTSAGSYAVKAQGEGSGFAFEIDDGSTNILDYEIDWYDNDGGLGNITTLSPNTVSNQAGAHTGSLSCNNGSNLTARILIRFQEDNGTSQDLGSAAISTYNGILTLIIAPQ